MKFEYDGYEPKFIQKQPCKDGSAHLFTLIYKFFSPVTNYFYILHADYHKGDAFAVKFYCKKDRHSDRKYSKIINRGDLGNILITCANVIYLLLEDYPDASFGFAGARTVDPKTNKVETYENNQRFRTYQYIIARKFGGDRFTHYRYESISSYLLVNNHCGDTDVKERELVKMFSETYIALPDIS